MDSEQIGHDRALGQQLVARGLDPGGDLFIHWRPEDDHIIMTGPVTYEFEGVLPDPIRRRTDKSGCDLSVDAELELLLGGFTPTACLPISRAGLEKLQNRFSLRRNQGMASVANDNWTLQSLWFLNAIARKRC